MSHCRGRASQSTVTKRDHFQVSERRGERPGGYRVTGVETGTEPADSTTPRTDLSAFGKRGEMEQRIRKVSICQQGEDWGPGTAGDLFFKKGLLIKHTWICSKVMEQGSQCTGCGRSQSGHRAEAGRWGHQHSLRLFALLLCLFEIFPKSKKS